MRSGRLFAAGSLARLVAAGPLFAWLAAFLVAPLGILVFYSLMRRGPYGGIVYELSFGNYARLADPLYLRIYGQSLILATSAALVCLVIGYPLAYAMARAAPRARALMLAGLMLPFLSNFVVRAYAIKVLLSHEGPVAAILGSVLGTTPVLTDSPVAVWLGMVTTYLPFMVLPLYASLARFDFTLLEAAADLGASARQAFWRVMLPGTRAGVAAGTILVLVPTLGEFMIPDLLGGARTMLLGNLITDQFLKARDWPFGAALVVLLALALVSALAVRALLVRATEEGR